MRDSNIVKYRRLLYKLQFYCKNKKRQISFLSRSDTSDDYDFARGYSKRGEPLTNFERGFLHGEHAAYNKVLRELHQMIEDAEIDWENITVRETT